MNRRKIFSMIGAASLLATVALSTNVIAPSVASADSSKSGYNEGSEGYTKDKEDGKERDENGYDKEGKNKKGEECEDNCKLLISKTAILDEVRDYDYSITKVASPNLALKNGEKGTITFTVTRTKLATYSSTFNLHGVITVKNTSKHAKKIKITDDTLSNVKCPTDTVPKKSEVTCDYTQLYWGSDESTPVIPTENTASVKIVKDECEGDSESKSKDSDECESEKKEDGKKVATTVKVVKNAYTETPAPSVYDSMTEGAFEGNGPWTLSKDYTCGSKDLPLGTATTVENEAWLSHPETTSTTKTTIDDEDLKPTFREWDGPSAYAYAVVSCGGMTLTKTASASSVLPGTSVTYSYTLKNDGPNSIQNVTLADDKCASPARSGSNAADTILDPADLWTYTCTQVINTTTTNKAKATGYLQELSEKIESNEASFTVTVVPTLQIPNVKVETPTTTQAPVTTTTAAPVTTTTTTTTTIKKVEEISAPAAPSIANVAGVQIENGVAETPAYTGSASRTMALLALMMITIGSMVVVITDRRRYNS